MRKWLSKLVDRLAPRLDLAFYIWSAVTTVSAFVTAHFAALNNQIVSFGPLGYWTAGLLGALVVAAIGAILSRARVWWVIGGAIDKWKAEVSGVNPLDDNFRGLRLKFHDLAHPITRRIQGKTFLNCELMGPANLLLLHNITLQGITFVQCDFVVLKPTGLSSGPIGLEDTNIIGGKVWNCTIFIAPALVPTFEEMNAHFVSLKPGEIAPNSNSP